jgi:molybdopterin molybdotransferase
VPVDGNLIEIDEARRLVLEHVARLGVEPVAVDEALGRVLAEDVAGVDPVPGFDSSAMDGFAVRAADTAGAEAGRPVRLALVDESRAGHPAQHGLETGEAIAISTGAMVPAGADAVVRVEDTAGADPVEIRVEVEPGRDIRRAGEDVRPGATVISAGTAIGPAELGVMVSVGRAEVQCARRPRVAVLATGDELQEPGEPLRPGAVRNSNAHFIAALIERSGAALELLEIVPDDRGATEAALRRALAADAAVISGGMSVGEHDHVRPALAALGVEQVFWGVALRPGKPTYFGILPARSSASRPVSPGSQRDVPVFGLPGNPVSAMVTFELFARPAIRAMLGAETESRRGTAILEQDYSKRPGRAHLVRCRLELGDDGWHATPTGPQGSHVLTSMLGADALAIMPTASAGVVAGERVEIELLE